MTDQEVKQKQKVKVYNFAKLATAIGLLATAVTAYVQVRKDQNNLLEVMSDKVDAIVLKVAYLEGRIEGLGPKAAASEAKKRVLPSVLPAPIILEPKAVAPDVDGDGVTVVESVADQRLYRPMPRSFDAIQTIVNQKVEQLDQKTLEAVAPPEPSGNL